MKAIVWMFELVGLLRGRPPKTPPPQPYRSMQFYADN